MKKIDSSSLPRRITLHQALHVNAGDEMRLVFLGGAISFAYALTAYFAAPLWGRLSDR